MKLEVPNYIVQQAEMTRAEFRLALAIQLYADNRIDHAHGLRLSGMAERLFDGELLSRGISIQKPRSLGQKLRKKHLAG